MSTLFRFQVYKRVRTLTIYIIWNCKEKSVTDPPYMLSRIIVHSFYSKGLEKERSHCVLGM